MNDKREVLRSPRKSSAPILIQYFQKEMDKSLFHLHRWLKANVVDYLDHKMLWHGGVSPQRLLCLYALPGIGKLSTVVSYCVTHKINMVYVNHHFYTDSMHEAIFAKAKANSPCIVYYDRAEIMVLDPARNTPFAAMYNVMLDSVHDDVWVVLAGMNDLVNIPHHIAYLIDAYGSLVYTPMPVDNVYKTEVLLQMLHHLAGTQDFPYGINKHDKVALVEWERFIQKLIHASDCCSYRDMWDFLTAVFRRFRQNMDHSAITKQVQSKLSLLDGTKHIYPSLRMFEQQFETLSICVNTNCSDERTLIKERINPRDRLYAMDECYDVYLSFHPSDCIRVEREEPVVSHKSQTTPVPICDDEDGFILPTPRFSTPIPPPSTPILKTSQQLKKPSIVMKRERIFYDDEDEEDAKRTGFPTWNKYLPQPLSCRPSSADITQNDDYKFLFGQN